MVHAGSLQRVPHYYDQAFAITIIIIIIIIKYINCVNLRDQYYHHENMPM